MNARRSSESKQVSRRGILAGMAAVSTASLAAGPSQGLRGKKVLVCVGEFSEGMETYYMVYRLIEEGVVPTVAATKVKLLQTVVHDFDPQYTNYTEKLGYLIQVDAAYQDIDPTQYHGLLIPGGRGPEEIRQNKDCLRIVGHFVDQNLPLGAMCHGPQVIYAARPIKGRRIAAYSAIRPDIEAAGGIFVDQPAVVDGAMVTSRGWPDLPYFMPKFLQVLAGR